MLEHDTLHTLIAKANPQELEFDGGYFYYDAAAGMLYISSSDLRSPTNRRYSVAVNGNNGLDLTNPNALIHNLIGGGNEYDGGSTAPADNTLFRREESLSRDFEFADPLNLDFRLQADSRFRGTAPDGSDRGPYPYNANIFYLSLEGDDVADGCSMRTSWRTFDRALSELQPGDTLYLAAGAYAAGLWQATNSGAAPIRIVGRGRGTVTLTGSLQVTGGNNLSFERLHFANGVSLQACADVAFNNCTFYGAAEGVSADSVQGLRITHALFAGVPLTLTQSTAVVLSGNLYAHTNACAVRMDTDATILYSEYNSYQDADHCWQLAGATWPLDHVRQEHDLHALVLAPAFDPEAAVPTLTNAAHFKGRGPHATALGIHHAYEADVCLELIGPFLHSTGDTTANIEWWSSHPASYALAWGEESQATTRVTRASPTRYTSFSLTGLVPGCTYTFEIQTADPSAVDPTTTVPVLTPENARLTFTTPLAAVLPKIYYVAPDGDDGNSGLSREQALRTVGRAADRVGPGDTVLIAGGQYAETVRIRAAGTPARPILFRAIAGEKPVFRGENLDRAFEMIDKPDIRLDGLYFQGFEWAGMLLRHSDRVQITRCLNVDIEADDSADVWIANCVLNGQWADFTAVALNDCSAARVENNVFVMSWIQQLRFSGAGGVLCNNIFCETSRGKVHQSLSSLAEDVVESNNCFYSRWPDSERLVVNGRTVFEHQVRTGSDSFAANPMLANVTGWRQGWQQSDEGNHDFAGYFATNPYLIQRGIGPQPQAFGGFPDVPAAWPYDVVWAEEFSALTHAAEALAQAGRNAEALLAYTNMAATIAMSDRLLADVLDQAALCADRLGDDGVAMTLAARIPIRPLAVRRRMALMVAGGHYADLLLDYADSNMGGYTFHLNYLYPELEDVMSDLFYYRSLAYAETGNLTAAEADLKIMNDKRFALQYRSGEAIHDRAWLRLGDFYRSYLHDDDQALAAYSNILHRTTWSPWGLPAKPLATGGSGTYAEAATHVCQILDGRGLHAEVNWIWADVRKAQAEAAANLLDMTGTLFSCEQLLQIPDVQSAELTACATRIDKLQYSRAKVVQAVAAMTSGITEDARDLLAAAAVASDPQSQEIGLRTLLLFAPLSAVNELLDRTEAVFYVALDGQHIPPHKSWATAATNIQAVIEAANEADGAVVWVSNGVYWLSEQIEVADLKLRSWPDGLSNRDTTILNGNFPLVSNRCVAMTHVNSLVEGFTITNGFLCNGSGGGVYSVGGVLQNCLIAGNTVTNGGGGGVYASGASTVVANCDIVGNTVWDLGGSGGGGGGLKVTEAATVWNSKIRYNRSPLYWSFGGGVHAGGNASLINCAIIGNTGDDAYHGGGVYCAGTTSDEHLPLH